MVIVKVPSSASVTCASSQAFSSPTPVPSIWRKAPSAGSASASASGSALCSVPCSVESSPEGAEDDPMPLKKISQNTSTVAAATPTPIPTFAGVLRLLLRRSHSTSTARTAASTAASRKTQYGELSVATWTATLLACV